MKKFLVKVSVLKGSRQGYRPDINAIVEAFQEFEYCEAETVETSKNLNALIEHLLSGAIDWVICPVWAIDIQLSDEEQSELRKKVWVYGTFWVKSTWYHSIQTFEK